MQLAPNIIAEDLFLYLKKQHVLVMSDLHIGFEERLHREGYLLPKRHLAELKQRIERAVYALKKNDNLVEWVVVNGDFQHAFSKIPRKEHQVMQEMILFLKQFGNVILVKGNHDKILSHLITDVPIVTDILYDDILVTHGDALSQKTKDAKIIIIGHEHPSIGLKSGAREERFRCFLRGFYNRKKVIVMPSCNLATEGSDILKEKSNSPYIKKVLDFDVFIVEDTIYDFGKARKLIK